jgi:hypothetical protein
MPPAWGMLLDSSAMLKAAHMMRLDTTTQPQMTVAAAGNARQGAGVGLQGSGRGAC